MKAKVYERKDRPGRWYVYLYWQGKRYKRYRYDENIPFVHPDLAKDIAAAVNADIKKKGKAFDPRQWFRTPGYQLQFSYYAENWLDDQTHYAPSYYGDVRRYVCRQMIPFFGKEDLREINKGRIKDFVRHLERHYKPKTIENILGILHKIFADAYDDEEILRIPPFPKLSVPEPELIYIPANSVTEIIFEIPEYDRPIFLFGFYYALRPGEVRALQWDCVDWDKMLFVVKRTFSGSILREVTKTKRIRSLPIMPEAEAILRQIRGISGFVFRSRYGKPYRKQRLSQLWREARDKVDVQKIPLYNAMRHSRAMYLLEEERWDLEHIRALLGHQRDEMARRYARASAKSLRKKLGNK